MAIQQEVHIRDKRSALATKREIGGAEVSYRGNARACSNRGGFSNLQRGSHTSPEKLGGLWLVVDGLSVGSDEADSAG